MEIDIFEFRLQDFWLQKYITITRRI